jgi:hypothetical protein
MYDVGLFCKSFRDDIDRFDCLLRSVEKHNVSSLPFLVSVPRRDLNLFIDKFGTSRFEICSDYDLAASDIIDGWTSQQIVKLNVYKSNFAKAYVMLDSDFFVIKDFDKSTFIHSSGSPYTVITKLNYTYNPNNRNLLDYIFSPSAVPPHPDNFQSVKIDEINSIQGNSQVQFSPVSFYAEKYKPPAGQVKPASIIKEIFQRTGENYGFMPCPVLSAYVLRSLEQDLLEPQSFTFAHLIAISPWEYHWYGEYLLSHKTIPIFPIEPGCICFARDSDIDHAKQLGISSHITLSQKFYFVSLAARHLSRFTF